MEKPQDRLLKLLKRKKSKGLRNIEVEMWGLRNGMSASTATRKFRDAIMPYRHDITKMTIEHCNNPNTGKWYYHYRWIGR